MIEYNNKDMEAIKNLKALMSEEEYDSLLRVFLAAYNNARTKQEAENMILQFVHDQPYYDSKKFENTDVGKTIIKGLREGSISPAPAPLQSTEKELGLPSDSDVMFNRLDEEALVKMFGAKDKDQMLNWDYPKHWSKLGYKDFTSMAKEAGLDPRSVMRSLAEMQELHDRGMIVEGYDPATGIINPLQYGGSTLMGLFTPRVKESIAAGNDPTMKDYAIDMGANVVQAVPIGRGIGLVMKGSRPLLRKGATSVVSAAGAPLLEETVDANAYDPAEHPGRGDFNLGRMALGTAVNLGTPLMIAGGAARFGRYNNNRTAGRATMDALMNDPYLDYLDRQQGSFNTVFDGQRLRNELDEAIMADIVRDMEGKDLKTMSAEKLEDYEAALNRKPNARIKMAREQKLGDILEGIRQHNPEFAKRYEEIFRKENPSQLTPTDILEESAFKYGLDEEGNLAYVYNPSAEEAKELAEIGLSTPAGSARSISSRRNLPQSVTDRSAVDLVDDQIMDIKAAGGDRFYPVYVTEFDKKVQSFLNDPEFMSRVNARDWKKGLGMQAGLSFATNKAGREDASPVAALLKEEAAESLNELAGGIPKSVSDVLADVTIRRQWDAGFKPDPKDEVMNEAYNIYMDWKKKQRKYDDSKSSSASADVSSSSVALPEVKVKAGKKAGF